MRAGSAVLGFGRSVWLIAAGIALVFMVLIGSDARAAGPLSPIQTWTEQTPVNHPSTQISGSMVFDPSTGQTILFGGTEISASSNQTWIWDGNDWTRKFPAHSPMPRVGASMAFDKKTGNVLLFGGTNTGAYYNDTWSWDGADWTNLNPATDPTARYGAGMAYDSANGEIVMYGGARNTQSSGSGTYLDDTWTWNGTDWTQETPANKPPAGFSNRMEFDPGLGRVLAYGIFNETTGFQQTWSWNGTNWTEIVTTHSPVVSNGGLMEYDPAIGSMVLFGGAGYNNQTWTFDGTDWVQLSTPASPPVRSFGAMSFDPTAGRMLLFGGYSPTGTRADTWYFGPPAGVESNWSQLTPVTSPPARNSAAMAFDPASGETVLFGGGTAGGSKLADTWTWNGTNWSQKSPASSPSARTGTASAFDPSTGEVVVFGGVNSSDTTLNQTWTWNGTTWTLETPANSPSPRNGAMMTYDEGSGEMVLFGGNFGSTSFDETWVWTGNNWVQRNPVHKPAGRYYGMMTFDQSTGETVLFGGFNGEVYLDDTWTWNGSDWTQKNPAMKPFGPYGGSMSFDPGSGEVFLFGGVTMTGFDSGNWIWTGSEWGPIYPDEQPDFRMLASMDFDPTVGEMLLFGGQTESGPKNDTWTFVKQVGRPTVQIDDPVFGQEIPIGSTYSTTFSCEEAPGGPGLASCRDEDGADAPTGQLDTSSAGEHFYEVTAISENGRSGVASVPYEVEKAEPEISMAAASSATIGGTIDADASLSGGYNPGGTITFRLYGPDDATCSGTPVFVNEARPVTDNGNYQAAFFRPTESGTYSWVAEYSGDENNGDAASACDETDSVSTLTTIQPTLTTGSATDAEAGTAITVKATLGGGFNPGGEITFRAYGPDDVTCSGAPAFESSTVPVTGAGDFDSPGFPAIAPGTYRWVATYSGDGNNETASSACGADGSISTVTATPDVCPASKPGLRLVGFGIKPPFGNSKKVMGLRVGFISANAVAKIKPSISYRLGGKKRTVRLKARTLKLDQRRNLRFRAPTKMKKDFRKAGIPLVKARVTFAVKTRIRPSVAAAGCFRNIGTKKLKTRVTEVSGRVALRRLG